MADLLSVSDCADQLRILSEPERLRILELLINGPHSVSAIADVLDRSLAIASHHLLVLKREKYVLAEKQGRQVFYRLNPRRFPPGTQHGRELRLGCCSLTFPG